MRDLWPEDIGPIPDLKAPVVILKEQASILGQKTNNLLEAEAVQLGRPSIGKREEFYYAFLIVAPPLDNYRYELFSISHGIDSYPVKINVDEEVLAEIGTTGETEMDDFTEIIVAKSEGEFLEILRKVFNSKKTKKVIGTLLSMVSYNYKDGDC